MAKSSTQEVALVLEPPKIASMTLKIVGTTPLICNRLDPESPFLTGEDEGVKTQRPKRDPDSEFQTCLYPIPSSKDFGFPAAAFKKAVISAVRFIDGMTMTKVRGALFVTGDLLKIEKGKPRPRRDVVRSAGMKRTPMLRYRAEFPTWEVAVPVRFNTAVMTAKDVAALFAIAGFHVGVGDKRPEQGHSNGQFTVKGGES